MNTRLQLRTMAALLRQGRPLDRLSALLLVVALLLAAWFAGGERAAAVLCLLSVPAALLQGYWAARVGLDLSLLDAVLEETDIDQAGSDLDAALHRLGLLPRLPPARDWSARWRGMRRLLRWQLASVALQSLLVLLAVLAALIAGPV
ncbi:hypothetical protein JR065_19925 [Xanthomonas sp. AmX2]|uniref:hypothetical protein n=1 Tax=Xanthomonas sp. TaxID=29446 RepID=UPI001981BD90|nr:hypothetical protein [Xanthomonas sp.]MBN6152606.1 hypothetical protein [Xanthomonas sp.]